MHTFIKDFTLLAARFGFCFCQRTKELDANLAADSSCRFQQKLRHSRIGFIVRADEFAFVSGRIDIAVDVAVKRDFYRHF